MENVSIGTRLMCVVARCHSEQEKKNLPLDLFEYFSGLSYIINPPTLLRADKTLENFIFLFFSDSFICPFYPSCQFERFRHGRRDCPADRTAERTGQTRRRFSSQFFQPTCSSRRQLLGTRYGLHQLLYRLELPNFQRQKHS